MIYCIRTQDIPNDASIQYVHVCEDLNGFKWTLTKVSNGLVISFIGDSHFFQELFYCDVSNGSAFYIKNTNYILFKDHSFEVLESWKEVITQQFTDAIWEDIESLFTERFEHSTIILESEKV